MFCNSFTSLHLTWKIVFSIWDKSAVTLLMMQMGAESPSESGNYMSYYIVSHSRVFETYIQGDYFGTRPKKMRMSQRLIIRF